MYLLHKIGEDIMGTLAISQELYRLLQTKANKIRNWWNIEDLEGSGRELWVVETPLWRGILWFKKRVYETQRLASEKTPSNFKG